MENEQFVDIRDHDVKEEDADRIKKVLEKEIPNLDSVVIIYNLKKDKGECKTGIISAGNMNPDYLVSMSRVFDSFIKAYLGEVERRINIQKKKKT